jgi:hypothetical protein
MLFQSKHGSIYGVLVSVLRAKREKEREGERRENFLPLFLLYPLSSDLESKRQQNISTIGFNICTGII